MTIRNKIKVDFFLEDGCTQENDEVSSNWMPINFSIYSDLFFDLINDAISEWLSDNKVKKHTIYEVIFAHQVNNDYGIIEEYFEPIYEEQRTY